MANRPHRFGRLAASVAIVGSMVQGCSTLWGFEDGKPLGEGSGGQNTAFGGASAKGGTATSHLGGVGGSSGGTTSFGGTTGASGGKAASTGGTSQGGRNSSGSGGGPSSQGGGNPMPQGGEGGAGANGGAGGEAGFGGACTGCGIGGRCVREGSLNESNPCLICDSARSTSDWSPRDGAACDDKVFCNGGDTCKAGSCSQHDGKDPCVANNDTCNATLDACCKSKLTNVCNANGNPVEVDSCGHEVRTLDACVTPNGSCVNGTCVCAAGWAGDDCSQCVRYVRAGASGAGDGTTWTKAAPSLSNALSQWPTCQIWVFQGTYTVPNATGTDARAATFTVPSGAKVFGGFAGSESKLADRDVKQHPSILSGDIGLANDASDNAYHVVTLGNAALLDGFTMSGGNANGTDANETGSAIYAAGATASVANCKLLGSLGAAPGASISVTDSTFTSDSTAISLSSGSVNLTRSTFTAGLVGGSKSKFTIDGSSFVGASTGVSGQNDFKITNTRFSGNDTAVDCDSSHSVSLDGVTIEMARIAFSMNDPKIQFRAHASTFRDNASIGSFHTRFNVDACTFIGNQDGFRESAGALVTSSVFVANTGALATRSAELDEVRFVNCTFYDNELTVGTNVPIVSIRSSVLWKNRTSPPVNVAVTYSEIDNPSVADPTNFNADPLFVSTLPGALDLRLRAGSPCIDRAPNDSLVPMLDGLGHERYDDPGTPNLNGTFTDLGAYEWRPE